MFLAKALRRKGFAKRYVGFSLSGKSGGTFNHETDEKYERRKSESDTSDAET